MSRDIERNDPNRSGLLAWGLTGLVGVLALAVLPLTLRQMPPTSAGGLISTLAWGLAIPAVFAVLGALIVHRQPGNRVGWLMMVTALASVSPTDAILGLLPPPSMLTPGLWLLAILSNWEWVPMIFAVFLIPLHFPTGRPPSPVWRWVNRLALLLALFFLALMCVTNQVGPLDESWTLPNPIGFIPLDWFNGTFLIFWGIGLMTIILGSVASLFVRYRRAAVVEREQIKWLLYAGAFFAVAYALTFFLTPVDADSDAWNSLILTIAILALPFAIAIAILRYRLYDIDVIIRKTLVYGLLTGLLGLVYFGSVVLIQSVFEEVTDERSPLILVLSTLAIAALFTPLRRRIQETIDRRFYRRKYDAQQVLAAFARTARDEVEMDALTAALLGVVDETMQPEQLSLLILSPKETG